MNTVLSVTKNLAVGTILVSLILFPLEGVFAEKNVTGKMKKEGNRVEAKMKGVDGKKIMKKEVPKREKQTMGKQKVMTDKMDRKEKSKPELKKSTPKEEKRMSSDMTKKGQVHIKGDELLNLRMQDADKKNGALLKKGDIKIEKKTQAIPYTGTVLAGTSAKLLDFTKADYDAVVKSDNLIVLYFYANWCPICKAEFPKMQEAFNSLTSNNVVGFRVNYNDNETDDAERDLAREFGVAYQHTKILLKNGEKVLKSPEGWEKDRYLSEINGQLAE